MNKSSLPPPSILGCCEVQLHYLEAWVSVWTSLSDDLPLCNPSSHRPIAIIPRQPWRQKTLSWLPQVPASQASSPHNYPGGWRRCHVAQKLCRDGKVIIPGVSVLLCLFAIPVSSSMHFLFIFPSHCSYFFFLLDGNSSSAIRKSSCLQLLSFLPSIAGGVIVLSCRSLKSIFFIFLADLSARVLKEHTWCTRNQDIGEQFTRMCSGFGGNEQEEEQSSRSRSSNHPWKWR